MNLKLVMALVSDDKTDAVVDAARQAGATGATVITACRGEGLRPEKTFLGLELSSQRDVVLFLVAEPQAREILETIAVAGQFDSEPGAGIAFQIAIEDAVGLRTQSEALLREIEARL
jgi:nitrogen regulatory protein PII